MTTHLVNVQAGQWMGVVTPAVERVRLAAGATWAYPDKLGPLQIAPGVTADVGDYLVCQSGSNIRILTASAFRAEFGSNVE